MSDGMLGRIKNKALVALGKGETAENALAELRRIAKTSQIPAHQAAARAGITRVIRAREAEAKREANRRSKRRR